MPRGLVCVVVATIVLAGRAPRAAQPARSDYRVVYASARQLTRQLDEAGREGYACVHLAQAEAGTSVPGIVVVLGRAVGGSAAPVSHRVIAGGGAGTDLETPLDRAGAEGFGLCGVVLDEEPPVPVLVAVLSRATSGPVSVAHYGVEVLTNYKASLTRLGAAARNGFRPVAAAPINNNRVPGMRSWMVITEQTSGAKPREIAVRSNTGPDGLQRALDEQTRQAFCLDLLWKEGNDVVALLSRAAEAPAASCSYAVDTTTLANVHGVSHRYVADVPFRAPDDRLVVSDRSSPATNDVEEDVLPALGPFGYATESALVGLGDHISRHHVAVPLSSRVRRLSTGALVLTTVVGDRAR